MDAVYQSDGERLLRRDRLADQGKLHRLRPRQLARQPHQRAPTGDQAAAHLGYADSRLGRHYPDIGAQDHLGPARRGVTVDGRDNGFEEGRVAQDRGVELPTVGGEALLPLADGGRVRIISGMVLPRSPPDEKAWSPAPVSSTTRTSGSFAASAHTSTRRTIISGKNAFPFSGRFRVT